MKQTGIRRLWLAVSACVGLVIGYIAMSGVAGRMQEGAFVRWHLLGHPGSEVVNIVSADVEGVYTESTDGTVYRGWFRRCYQSQGRCWEEVDSADISPDSNVGTQCSSNFREMRNPPGRMLQCASVHDSIGAEFFREVHYALLEDGTIWWWESSEGRMSADTMGAAAICASGPCLGALLGLTGGLALSRLYNRLSRRPT